MAVRFTPTCPLAAFRALQNLACPRGDACCYAHNVFEYWLHPSRCAGIAHVSQRPAMQSPACVRQTHARTTQIASRISFLNSRRYRTQLCNDGVNCKRKWVHAHWQLWAGFVVPR